MYEAPARTWIFSSSSTSASAYVRTTPNAVIVPSMASGTYELEVWYTEDGDDVTDAAATWIKLVDEDGDTITIPAESACRVQFTIPLMINLDRTRLKAVDSSGTAVTQTTQEVKPLTLVI